ncbi:MAG: ATP-binding protein [Oscillospiraceae bacterium]|jgi:DNA replication protein DnaC|nr:ATP-binding protein [Oscillospiraceae bacterium]
MQRTETNQDLKPLVSILNNHADREPKCKAQYETQRKSQYGAKYEAKHEAHCEAKYETDHEAQYETQTRQTCPVCGRKNLVRTAQICGKLMHFRIMCECEEKEQAAEEELQKQHQKAKRIAEIKSLSLLGKRYENAAFENSEIGMNPSFDTALNHCKKYCENFKQMLEKGQGIYIYGGFGVGKTHLTACIANELMKNFVPVLFTNLFEISKAVKSTFGKASFGKASTSVSSETEQSLIEKFSKINLLIFDDLGKEIFVKNESDTWLQNLLFDLINRRYNELKSTIFSSNYSLKELVEKRGLDEAAADRIAEMTKNFVFKISGKSRR